MALVRLSLVWDSNQSLPVTHVFDSAGSGRALSAEADFVGTESLHAVVALLFVVKGLFLGLLGLFCIFSSVYLLVSSYSEFVLL